MGKVEEVERLVAEFKQATEASRRHLDAIRDLAVQRGRLLRELNQYITYKDIAMLVDVGGSNVSRLIARARAKHDERVLR